MPTQSNTTSRIPRILTSLLSDTKMSTIGKITNSILSGSNENNLSLATLNIDFSLFQFEAPKEYEPLAAALSTHRRQDAEEGQPHRTARRLGTLFEEMIPSTPKLIDAFGQRVSQIVQTPGINPRGDSTHGPFEKFVGADGTTLWAAATSGIPAIGVYLLSCLLAQAWDSKQATALWVELVKERQMEIQHACEKNHKVSVSTLFAARQDISREDLARWDNSARSWLRRANQAKSFESHQLMLISKNMQLPIVTSSSTYASVMSAWIEAMVGLEALLSGQPVEVSSGSLFLDFSSWYLFPDLIVLGTTPPTHVKFRDTLFPPGGKCTARQRAATTEHSGGIRWSLAFSHLRYYGDPVVVQNNPDYSRVTFRELMVVVLGCLFKDWQISDRDQCIAAQWLLNLWALVQKPIETEYGSTSRFSWLKVLAEAASDFIDPEPSLKLKNTRLIRFGRRRGQLFSVGVGETSLPFFGICSPLRLASLSQKDDPSCGITYLRVLTQKMGLSEENVIICHAIDGNEHDNPANASLFQVMTAIPHTYQTRKRDSSGAPIYEKIHSRWFISRAAGVESKIDLLMSECHKEGEFCSSMGTGSLIHNQGDDKFTWPLIPNIYCRGWNSQKPCCTSGERASIPCDCLEFGKENESSKKSSATFRSIFGDWRLGIYVQEADDVEETYFKDLHRRANTCLRKPDDTLLAAQSFAHANINPRLLTSYLGIITRIEDNIPTPTTYETRVTSEEQERGSSLRRYAIEILLVGSPALPNGLSRTLYTLELASRVYSNLHGATIPLTILSRPLFDDAWVPAPLCEPLVFKRQDAHVASIVPSLPVALTREQAFSCVAKFESGVVDLNPHDLHSTLALCSEDSMFVASVFLLDPFDQPVPHKLRRIVGNISHPGISLLVAPENPKIRNRSESYTAVTHASYDFQREDNFAGTSLHLSFTDWRFPLEAGGYRTIDQDVLVVESVISVLDRGNWVADLDILCIDFEALSRIAKDCDQHKQETHDLEYDYTSIDNWDELLDAPENVGIFRAHGNWAARLAAISILSQQGQGHSIAVFGRKKVCFRCLEADREDNVNYLMDHESPLPSICID